MDTRAAWPVGRRRRIVEIPALCGPTHVAHLLSNWRLMSERIGIKFDVHECRLEVTQPYLHRKHIVLPFGCTFEFTEF